jgi:hypothetical protein
MSVVLRDARLRANPAYRAVPRNRLTPEERAAFPVEPEDYGVLIPRPDSTFAPMAIDRDTALLFLTLQEPGPPPDFAFANGAGSGERDLHKLLLSRVLELEGPSGYVSGLDACELIGVAPIVQTNPLTRLSIEALQFGAAWPAADVWSLTQKLYGYNRRPLTPVLRRQFGDSRMIADMLGIVGTGPTRRALDADWEQQEPSEAWTSFVTRRAARDREVRPCKLYVGLAFEELPQRLPAIIEALGRGKAHQFKIGVGLSGMLRPDKLVAYFPSKDALLDGSQKLLPAVEDAVPHGVPFSAAIDRRGILSWGSDPLAAVAEERMSWRQWICRKSAEALMAARDRDSGDLPAWRFVLERLRLDGVDVETFMPTANWSGEF